jgi:hypothetical protein
MPMQSVIQTYGPSNKLSPLYNSEDARVIPVNLPPGVNYPAGQILVQSAQSVNDVQTITPPGSGTYILTFTNPLTGISASTTALAFGAVDATVQAAIQSAVTASGGGTVTVAALAATFSGTLAARPVPPITTNAGSVAHTTTGTTAKTFGAYSGSGSPSIVLEYPTITDASGNTVAPVGAFFGSVQPYVSAFYSGTFNCADLTGLDANAVTKMSGVIVAGTVSVGTFKFG